MPVSCYTDAMHDKERPSVQESAKQAISLSGFLLKRRETIRALFMGKLFEPEKGEARTKSKARAGKEWRNVAEHCVDVARGLDALSDLLELPEEDRERMVHVALIHDWNKRLQKNAAAFTDDERAAAVAYTQKLMERYDPDGMLLNATEADGLDRLETPEATKLEHYVHMLDLSCMPDPVNNRRIVPPEVRIADLMKRHVKLPHDRPDFWTRLKAMGEQEEHMILEELREKGVPVAPDARLCDVLSEKIAKG